MRETMRTNGDTVAARAIALLVYSLVTNARPASDARYLSRNAVAAAVLLADARRRLSWSALGLARRDLRRGLSWGVGGACVTVAAVRLGTGVGARLRAGQALLSDRRADLPPAALRFQILVRIPVGTAAFEELVFRGVLLATLERAAGRRTAVLGSSLVFGLWHVGPTLAALRENRVSRGRAPAVAGAVAVTALAGGALAALRVLSGHLAAPVLVHWAANAAGLVAAHRWQAVQR